MVEVYNRMPRPRRDNCGENLFGILGHSKLPMYSVGFRK